jgi:hypothetical protein
MVPDTPCEREESYQGEVEMTLEWVRTLGSILISWPMVAAVALLVLRGRILSLVDWFTSNNVERLKIGALELERRVEGVVERQELQAAEISAIQVALKGVLTKHEIGLLAGLNSPPRLMLHYEPDLYRYLHRLDGLNFIQPTPGHGLYMIEEQHRDDEKLPVPPEQRPPFDLKEYVYITTEGQRYLGILNTILSAAEESLAEPPDLS